MNGWFLCVGAGVALLAVARGTDGGSAGGSDQAYVSASAGREYESSN